MTFYRVSAKGRLPLGDSFITSFHVSTSRTLSQVHTSSAAALQTFWTALKPFLPAATHFTDTVTTSLLLNNGKNDQAQADSFDVIGTGAGNAVSQQAAILITHHTAKASRAGRGRQYFPAPVTAAVATDGSLAPATQTAIIGAYRALMTSINASDQLVVLHGGFIKRLPDGTVEYDQLSSDPVTSAQVRNVLATQRRRTNKVTPVYT